ncbi:hypothetical protein ALP86_101976 [Pseudomonas amygdali pv. mori]|uniref:Uncharacterized protein n=1 Tax=Pseudomonas amygdali pv. mori TaxID=34065 RepID=A0A3M4VB81_PSEA0|nr:hypothetical protein ALP86_101976 [Pseudomonas amygdali pv. mori]RMT13481.1 hypothetical protein ALP52_101838 [Pseudomonas amygdali pv. mori]
MDLILMGQRQVGSRVNSASAATRRSQNAIKRRFRRQIAPLIGQARHDLARRQVSVLRAVAQHHNGLSLCLVQRIWRRWPSGSRSRIGLDSVCLSPPWQGAQRQTNFPTGPDFSGSRRDRFAQTGHE